MQKRNQFSFSVLALSLALGMAGGAANAEMNAEELARLGKDLTPVGAEKAGNKDGSIPAWTGGLTKAPAGFDPAKGYTHPLAAEKPLFTITAANIEQYKDKLAPGQIEMLKRYPSFKMNIYASQRTAAYPNGIYDQVKTEGSKTKLAEGGNGVLNAEKTTVPFPLPKSGLEVLWNHMSRYYGGTWTRYNAEFPVQTNGAFTPVTRVETFAAPAALDKIEPNRLYYYVARLTGPSSVAGDGILVHEPMDQVKEGRLAWIYNPGSRRVLRAPQFAYDAPGSGADGLRTIDDRFGFNGAPDRYEWKLVGKKEMFISYNNFSLSNKALKYKDMIQPAHMNPDLVRYEPHRVWVVEAKLKSGMRHVYAKRVLYIDEDSWSIAHADQYDGRGELWRVRDVHLMPFYDQQMTWGISEVLYDLQARRYLVSDMMNEERPAKFGEKLTLNAFSTEALRRQAN
ncbi:MAG: DUF1329 domain-containing protein [Zoogloea sp.]|jgi:hypothetical protein|uniref:DUF1329 domain-containing protein n=1 Tax=Dokdonella sp. TaxID=2291710 RepID=UPI002DD67E3C|nr:DUF1329 domain-containing protein [Dokdonella sp.]MBL0285170.1 DUF1329 domain-containing protein [Zoogloea sp.]